MGRAGVRWDEVEELGEAVDTPALEGAIPTSIPPSAAMVRPSGSRAIPGGGRPPATPAGDVARREQCSRTARKQFALDLVRPGIFLYGGVAAAGVPAPQPSSACGPAS